MSCIYNIIEKKKLDAQEIPQRDNIKANASNLYPWCGPKDQEKRQINSSHSLGSCMSLETLL